MPRLLRNCNNVVSELQKWSDILKDINYETKEVFLMVKIKLSKIVLLGIALVTMIFVSQVQSHAASRGANLQATATTQLGKPYMYGATGDKGFDCSGLTQYVFEQNGINLPRTAQEQFNATKRIRAVHAKKGDLVFFGKNTKSIYHVGLYLGKGKMIDSQLRGVVIENVHAPWWKVAGYTRVA